jgi:hypothetical protein
MSLLTALLHPSHTSPLPPPLQGEQGDWQPERESFNVIPTKEFGYAMLRMPV